MSVDEIIKLFEQYRQSIESQKPEDEIDRIKKRLDKAIEGLSNAASRSLFSQLEKDIKSISELKVSLDPVEKNRLEIEALAKRMNGLDDFRELWNETVTFTPLFSRTDSKTSNKVVIKKLIAGWKNFKVIAFGAISVLLLLIGAAAYTGDSLIDYVNTTKDKAVEDINTRADSAEEEFRQTTKKVMSDVLETTDIINHAVDKIEARLSSRLIFGQFSEAIGNLHKAIDILGDRRMARDFRNMRPYRLDELELALYSYASFLKELSVSQSFDSKMKYYDCAGYDFVAAHNLVTHSILHWAKGAHAVAYSELPEVSWYCQLPEIAFVESVLTGAGHRENFRDPRFEQAVVLYQDHKLKYSELKNYLSEYAIFVDGLSELKEIKNKEDRDKAAQVILDKFDQGTMPRSNDWQAVVLFYKSFINSIKNKAGHEVILKENISIIDLWHGFTKVKNQVLTAISKLESKGTSVDLKKYGKTWFEAFNWHQDLYGPAFESNNAVYLDSIVRSSTVLIKKNNLATHSFLSDSQERRLVLQTRLTLSKMCQHPEVVRQIKKENMMFKKFELPFELAKKFNEAYKARDKTLGLIFSSEFVSVCKQAYAQA